MRLWRGVRLAALVLMSVHRGNFIWIAVCPVLRNHAAQTQSDQVNWRATRQLLAAVFGIVFDIERAFAIGKVTIAQRIHCADLILREGLLELFDKVTPMTFVAPQAPQ